MALQPRCAAVGGRVHAVGAAAVGVLGLIDVIIAAYFLHHPGPNYLNRLWFSQLWIAIFATVFAIDALGASGLLPWSRCPTAPPSRWLQAHDVLVATISFTLFALYAAAYRVDACLPMLAVFGMTAGTALVRRGVCGSAATAPAAAAVASPGDHVSINNVASAKSLLSDPSRLTADEAVVWGATGDGGGGSGAGRSAARGPCACCTAECGRNAAIATVRGLTVILFGLMLGGAGTEAHGWRAYPPRGTMFKIETVIPDGSGATVAQEVHAWCTGPTNTSRPTFWFEIGGGGHSMSDLWGLQFALNDNGWRTCTYDMPGCAWSGYGVNNQPYVTEQLMAALGEPGPFIMLGTMDDGPVRAYQFALDHPAKVAAVIAITWAPPEFVTYQQYHGLSHDAALQYARNTIAGRLQLCDIIRGIATHWGFMPFFLPSNNTYQPAALAAEARFLNTLNEKQWTTQCQYLANQVEQPEQLLQMDLWYTNRTLAADIPVFVFYNQQNGTQACVDAQLPITSDDCQLLVYSNNAALAYSQMMVNMTAGSRIIMCNDCPGLIPQGPNIPWATQEVLAIANSLQ